LKKDQNDSNDTIVDSGKFESRINVNLQLSHSDDVNTEKVEVQSNSDNDEYEYVPTDNSGQIESKIDNVQLVSDDLRPKEDIESRKVHEEENNNDDPGN